MTGCFFSPTLLTTVCCKQPRCLTVTSHAQTMEGTEPSNVCAAELVAVFTYEIIPTLRQHYIDDNDPEVFVRACKEHTVRMGLPEESWPQCTFPAAVSIDWDPRHYALRQWLSVPRAPRQEVDRFRRHAYEDALEVFTLSQLPCTAQRAQDLRARSGAFSSEEEQAEAERSADWHTRLASYKLQNGCDPADYDLWQRSLWLPEYITWPPWTFMPLSKVSPDLHHVAEHMVGTVKHEVWHALREMDLNDKALYKGKTYQQLLVSAVASRGNGEKGLKHIKGSVSKHVKTCKILAADAGTQLQLVHDFGSRVSSVVHNVAGTGGNWIRDSKWT